MLVNLSDGDIWVEDGLSFTELIRQEYRLPDSYTIFSGGTLEGHPVDTAYLKIERDGRVDLLLYLRPDEVAILAWILTGCLWSHLIEKVTLRVPLPYGPLPEI